MPQAVDGDAAAAWSSPPECAESAARHITCVTCPAPSDDTRAGDLRPAVTQRAVFDGPSGIAASGTFTALHGDRSPGAVPGHDELHRPNVRPRRSSSAVH